VVEAVERDARNADQHLQVGARSRHLGADGGADLLIGESHGSRLVAAMGTRKLGPQKV
jgi:hypothetical protein